jgi:uncharacterized protein (DUF2249 family)
MTIVHDPRPALAGTQRFETEIDLRPMSAMARHLRMFLNFAILPEGEAFVIVDDQDPKPIWYQFAYEHKVGFTWEYLQMGPAAWRVRIGRVGPTG